MQMNMRMQEYMLSRDDFITGDKIHQLTQELHVPSVQYIKMDFIKQRRGNIVSLRGWRDRNETIDLSSLDILVTGHSDYSVDECDLAILQLPRLKAWFCVNKNIDHPKLHAIPLGITNKDEPASLGRHKIIGNTDRIYEVACDTPRTRLKNLVYMNMCVPNYTYEREYITKRFAQKSWVTLGVPDMSNAGHETFLRNVRCHRFAFAPRGNGLDTHRLWECLYLGTIPIVKKHVSMNEFADLPILFVDDWDDVTEELLHKTYDEMTQKKYNMHRITIAYWRDKIRELASHLSHL